MRETTGYNRRDILAAFGAAAVLFALSTTVKLVNAADGQMLKVGIIGSGHVGSALGGAWAKAGNEVMFSSRNLDSDKKLAAKIGANARAGTPQEAAAFGQVILIAVPYSAFPELTKSLGSALKGKVVINASNPFPERDGEIANQARAEGAGSFDAHMLPGTLVIRAFNAVGAARMANAHENPVRSACRSQVISRPYKPLRGWFERRDSSRLWWAVSRWASTSCQVRRSRGSIQQTNCAALQQH